MREERKKEQDSFKLTRPQQKAMNKEIRARVLTIDDAYYLDMDAAVLWVLRVGFGFGKKRLRRFFEKFVETHAELRKHYSLDDDDNGIWICRQQLKEYGVDVEAWEKEFEDYEHK